MTSKAKTVEEYLAALPADRRAAITAVREAILRNLDPVYKEGITYGMIGYFVPHSVYPAGYHCDPKQPLPFVNLGSQKNYMSLHLGFLYSGGDETSPAAKLQEWFVKEWAKTGKKLDMGKACVRFKSRDDVAPDVIGNLVAKMPATKWIAMNEHFAEMRQSPKKAAKRKS